MARDRNLLAMGLVAVAVMLFVGSAYAGEERITRKDLPTKVLSAFEQAYPKAVIKGLAREKEGGKIFYEIESIEGKIGRDVLYSSDGTLVEVEEEVALSDLPVVVMTKARKEFPNGRIAKAEKTIRGPVVLYELHVVIGKARQELTLDPTGKIVRHEKEETDEGEEHGIAK